jgi:hypothetical protein
MPLGNIILLATVNNNVAMNFIRWQHFVFKHLSAADSYVHAQRGQKHLDYLAKTGYHSLCGKVGLNLGM